MPAGMGTLRADFEKKIDRFIKQLEGGDGSQEKYDVFFRNLVIAKTEIEELTPEQKTVLLPTLRDKFYKYLQAGKFLQAGLVLALFEDTPELHQCHFLPQNPKEEELLRKMTVQIMCYKVLLFKNQYMDSGEYSFDYEAGNVRVDGANKEKKLNCISFTLLFMMKVLGEGELKKVGKREVANLGGKTAPDLADMFAARLPETRSVAHSDPQQLRLDVINSMWGDLDRDGAAIYVCQAYKNIDGEVVPTHAFVVVAYPLAGEEKTYEIWVLESNPPRPRVVRLWDKLGANPYVKIDMKNLMPSTPEDQLELFRAGVAGYNLPKGKKAQ
jgi:hypothetical protein